MSGYICTVWYGMVGKKVDMLLISVSYPPCVELHATQGIDTVSFITCMCIGVL